MLVLKKKVKRMMMIMTKKMMRMMMKTMIMRINLKQIKVIKIIRICSRKRQINNRIVILIIILRWLTKKKVYKRNLWNHNHLVVSSKQKNNLLHSICLNNINKGSYLRWQIKQQLLQINISRRKLFSRVSKR